MFCKNCGTPINDDGAFCPTCGASTGIAKSAVPTDLPKANQNASTNGDIKAFIDCHVRAQSVFVTAEDFIKGAKPLRFRWYIASVAGFMSAFIHPGLALFVAPTAFLLGGILVSAFKLLLLNRKKYPLNEEIDLDDLTLFLRNNLSFLPFSNWQRGVPSNFGIKDNSVNIIECTFEGKTIHRIQFPVDKNFYKIICNKTSRKSLLLNGGKRSSALMYKNGYKVKPILEAAMQYYLAQQKN